MVVSKHLSLMLIGTVFVVSHLLGYVRQARYIAASLGISGSSAGGDATLTTTTSSFSSNANLTTEVESLRAQVKKLLLQQQPEAPTPSNTEVESLRAQVEALSLKQEEATEEAKKQKTQPKSFALDHNDLDVMERHTCFPVKDICTTGREWFYRTRKSNTRAYQPNFIFRNNLLAKEHNIPPEMTVNNSFYFDVDWQKRNQDAPACQVSSIPNHIVVTSWYMAMATEVYGQVIGGMHQLWTEIEAPWWKETPSSPHVQMYALTQAQHMKRGPDTEQKIMSSLHALTAGFTAHPMENYLRLHNTSLGCRCFQRLIFCGVGDADDEDRKQEDKKRRKDPTYNSTKAIPPPNAPIKHVAASNRVGSFEDSKHVDNEALRVHVRKGAYDVYTNLTQKVEQFKRNALVKELEKLVADLKNGTAAISDSVKQQLRAVTTTTGQNGLNNNISIRGSGGLEGQSQYHLDDWTMIGFSQRSSRRRWLNLKEVMDYCRTHWLVQHKIVCVEINLDTPFGGDAENQVVMHAGLDALIGIHGSQNVHTVWMPDRSYSLEILPHITGPWGGWTQTTHQPTCNGFMMKNINLNHVGYGLNETSWPNCTAPQWQNVTHCNDGQKWDARDFLVPSDAIKSFVEKFVLPSPSDGGGTITRTPPRKCSEYEELSKQEFVLYNVVCQEDEPSEQPIITKQYYRQRTSFSHLEKRR